MSQKTKVIIAILALAASLMAVKTAKAASYLNVSLNENTPAGRVVASPSSETQFLTFNLTSLASSTENSVLNRLVVTNFGTSGNQARSSLSNVYLYEGDQLIARTALRFGQNGYLFRDFAYSVPTNTTKVLTVKAEVNISVQQQQTVILGFNNQDSLRASGAVTGARTIVSGNFPVQGRSFTVRGGLEQSLMVRIAENNPATSTVVAGASNVPVLALRFSAINLPFKIYRLRIVQAGNPDYRRSVHSLTITYNNQAGQEVTTTQAPRNGYADFNIMANPLYVARNDVSLVNVYVNLRAIGAQDNQAKTGDQVRFFLSTTQGFLAVAMRQQAEWYIREVSHGDIGGNVMVVRGSVPTIEADLQNNTDLVNGSVELYRFRVSASEGSNIALKKFSFILSMDDSVADVASLTLRNFEVYEGDSYGNVQALTQADSGDNSYQIYNGRAATTTIADGIPWGNSGRLSHPDGIMYYYGRDQKVIVVFNDERVIESGSAKYYILKATAENVNTGNQSHDSIGTYMTTSFGNDNDNLSIISGMHLEASCDARERYVNNWDLSFSGVTSKYCLSTDGQRDDTPAYLIWSDFTGNNGNGQHQDTADDRTTSSADWFNGWGIRNLGAAYSRTLIAE